MLAALVGFVLTNIIIIIIIIIIIKIIIIIITIIIIIIIVNTLFQEATHLTARQSSLRASHNRKN